MTVQEIIGTLQTQQQKIKELQSTPYYTELEKREKKINILENLLKKLREENENKDIEIKDLEYNINKTNNSDNTDSLRKELEEKNQKIKELEQLNDRQNVHFNFNKETQTSNVINNTQTVTKLIHSKIIPEIPITV
jgi:predicted RNase H-like nuclease (RuvC/YqgF family)